MLKQELNQKLLHKLSPQQIQLMKLVQLPTLVFEERVRQELEINPALENIFNNEDTSNLCTNEYSENLSLDEYEDYDRQSIDISNINIDEYLSDDEIPNYKINLNTYSEDYNCENYYAQSISFLEYLLEQLYTFSLSEKDQKLCEFLIGNLDESGYIRRILSLIVNDLILSIGIYTEESHLEYLLTNIIQKLEPIGIGARNLKECLLLQLKEKNNTYAINNAIKILTNYFDLFIKKHYYKIQISLNINEKELKDSIKEIEKLNPKPGKSFSENSKNFEQITPDFIIRIFNNELELSLNGRNTPELRISRSYSELLETYKDTEYKSKNLKEAAIFIKHKLDSAKWFIDAVKQRKNTLLKTMTAIMSYQKEYFLSGNEENIKPMILKDIAEIVKMDISTVSRVANSKYVSTPYGTLLIKDLFSEGLTNKKGEEVSTKEIKKILIEIINQENKKNPFTDEKLMKILKNKGYNIARRTISKYREQMNISVARLRKKI